MTIQEALRTTTQALTATSDAPALDAQRLLLHVLQKHETSWLMAHSETVLTASQQALFGKLLQRRLSGEPLAYILGSQEFYGRSFIVTPDVLIPRPTTEELIDHALPAITKLSAEKKRPLVIADIGTGSGCIIVTLVCELANFQFPISNFQFIATDISRPALRVAKKNAQRYHVADRIEFLHGDMLEPVMNKNIDLIVSNPPYVPTEALAKAGRSPDTIGLQFEPRIALNGGSDGQNYMTQIILAGLPTILEGIDGVIQEFSIQSK